MNQPRRAGTKERTEKHSDNAEVNKLIALMREVAVRLVKLGDDYEAVKDENNVLEAQVASMEGQVGSMEGQLALYGREEGLLGDWEELLLNFRSGVVDQGELLEGTVGRS